VRTSRLTARIDNNAIADGFQIYLHSFVVTREGEWAIVQQGMNEGTRVARRYHWHSAAVRDFTADPHTAIVGESRGAPSGPNASFRGWQQVFVDDPGTGLSGDIGSEIDGEIAIRVDVGPAPRNTLAVGQRRAVAGANELSNPTSSLL